MEANVGSMREFCEAHGIVASAKRVSANKLMGDQMGPGAWKRT